MGNIVQLPVTNSHWQGPVESNILNNVRAMQHIGPGAGYLSSKADFYMDKFLRFSGTSESETPKGQKLLQSYKVKADMANQNFTKYGEMEAFGIKSTIKVTDIFTNAFAA